LPNRYARRLEVVEAEHIDAKMVRRDALAVEWVDAAGLAEVVPGSLRVELVLGEELVAREKLELAFVDLDHESILATADRAVAHGELRKVGFDLESDRSAMATADMRLQWTATHSLALRRGLTFESSGAVRRPLEGGVDVTPWSA
jgi:hypothetical protein